MEDILFTSEISKRNDLNVYMINTIKTTHTQSFLRASVRMRNMLLHLQIDRDSEDVFRIGQIMNNAMWIENPIR